MSSTFLLVAVFFACHLFMAQSNCGIYDVAAPSSYTCGSSATRKFQFPNVPSGNSSLTIFISMRKTAECNSPSTTFNYLTYEQPIVKAPNPMVLECKQEDTKLKITGANEFANVNMDTDAPTGSNQWVEFAISLQNTSFGFYLTSSIQTADNTNIVPYGFSALEFSYSNANLYLCSTVDQLNPMGCQISYFKVFYGSFFGNSMIEISPVLVGQYKLYEGSGYSLANSANSAQKGYLGASTASVPDTTNSPSWSNSADNGLIFGTDTQYVSLSTFNFKAASPVFQGSMTISLWVKLTQFPSSSAYLFRIFDPSNIAQGILEAQVRNDGALAVTLPGYTSNFVTSSNIMDINTWKFISVSFAIKGDGVLFSLRLFISGHSISVWDDWDWTSLAIPSTLGARIGGPPSFIGNVGYFTIHSPGGLTNPDTGGECIDSSCTLPLGITNPKTCLLWPSSGCHATCGDTLCTSQLLSGCLSCKNVSHMITSGTCEASEKNLLCPQGQYYYSDGTCNPSCNAPYNSRNESGQLYCELCTAANTVISDNDGGSTTRYYYPSDKSCKYICPSPYTVRKEGALNFCEIPLSTEQKAQIQSVSSSSSTAGNVVTAGVVAVTAFVPADPNGISAGSLAKLFEYTRYFNVSRSPKLAEFYSSHRSVPGTVTIGPGLPTDAVMKMPYHPVPQIMALNNVHSSFLVNFFDNLQTLLIISAGVLLVLGIEMLINKYLNKYLLYYQKVRIGVIGFLVMQFYNIYAELTFFSIIEFRTFEPSGALGSASLFIAIFFVLLGSLFLFLHAQMIKRYQACKVQELPTPPPAPLTTPPTEILAQEGEREGEKKEDAKKGEETAKEPESTNKALVEFQKRHENVDSLYKDFKDTSFIHQGYLWLLALRTIICNIALAALTSYSLAPIIVMMVMNLGMMVYLLVKFPYKNIFSVFQQVAFETDLLVTNICFLILACLDERGVNAEEYKETLGEIIIITIIISKYLTLITLIPKVILALLDILKKMKKVKKEADAAEALARALAGVRNTESPVAIDGLNPEKEVLVEVPEKENLIEEKEANQFVLELAKCQSVNQGLDQETERIPESVDSSGSHMETHKEHDGEGDMSPVMKIDMRDHMRKTSTRVTKLFF